MSKCEHPLSTAWESYPKSKKSYNGFYKCKTCSKIFFNPMLKEYMEEKNGVKRKTYLSKL